MREVQLKLNPDVRPCGKAKKNLSENYCTNMCSILLRLRKQLDVFLGFFWIP